MFASRSNPFVAVGDMLDQMTGGRFISTPHRVVPPPQGTSRISVPFFFDFSWDAKMEYLPLDHLPALTPEEQAIAKARWEQTTFTGVCECFDRVFML